MVLKGITIDRKPLKDHLEAIGHRDAFRYVEGLVKSKTELSEYAIKCIHSLVLMDRPEDKGVYRRIPVRIMGAFHEPPQPYLVEPMMNDLILKHRQRKVAMSLIEATALFHLDFEGIPLHRRQRAHGPPADESGTDAKRISRRRRKIIRPAQVLRYFRCLLPQRQRGAHDPDDRGIRR